METYRNAGHVELFEDGGKMNIKLTAVSIKLTVLRTEIVFIYYFMIPFNNFCSTPSGLTKTNARQLNFRNCENIISNRQKKTGV
jgi:hypothetical protein